MTTSDALWLSGVIMFTGYLTANDQDDVLFGLAIGCFSAALVVAVLS